MKEFLIKENQKDQMATIVRDLMILVGLILKTVTSGSSRTQKQHTVSAKRVLVSPARAQRDAFSSLN